MRGGLELSRQWIRRRYRGPTWYAAPLVGPWLKYRLEVVVLYIHGNYTMTEISMSPRDVLLEVTRPLICETPLNLNARADADLSTQVGISEFESP